MNMQPALAPLSIIYSTVMRARAELYRRGVFRTHRAGAPVVSVGNITTGGTGKTPLVAWLARRLAAENRKVCVLSRGYGRADERRRVLVSDGERILADAREGGDEPLLLAESLRGEAAVVSDADRVSAARWARKNLGADAFILDDGFQHLRLARSLDIVTVDATSPWGGNRVLPAGRLREPVSGLARAGCVVITRADLAEDIEAVRAEVVRACEGRSLVLTSRMRTRGVRPLERHGRVEDEAHASGQTVAAFCAVGNPRAFFEQLRRDGRELTFARSFTDHHYFTQDDIDELSREAEKCGARALLTTTKDAVKLRGLTFSIPCYVVEVELELEDEEALMSLVRRALTQSEA